MTGHGWDFGLPKRTRGRWFEVRVCIDGSDWTLIRPLKLERGFRRSAFWVSGCGRLRISASGRDPWRELPTDAAP